MGGMDIAWIVGMIIAFTFYTLAIKLSEPSRANEVSEIRIASTIE